MTTTTSAKRSGPAPTASCPCKHLSHNGMMCGNQIGVDQDVCVECKDHQQATR
jgi:hypothetical protein